MLMNEKDVNIIKNMLGDDFFDTLEKSDVGALVNRRTQTAVSPEEVKIALQIVPRTILSYLFANLKHREIGDAFNLDLPFCSGAVMSVNKKGPDNYSGEIVKEGQRLIEFKHRPLPSLGLIILTTFELYDMALLDEVKKNPTSEDNEKVEKLQDLIDERLNLQCMVQNVVDRRISEREAISKLIKEKLNSHIEASQRDGESKEDNKEDNNSMEESQDKKSKLRQFLESREKKRQEPIELDKNEIKCPDCKTSLYKGEENAINLCICYGEHMGKNIKFSKLKNSKVKLNFPKTFDIDNIEMLLDALKNR